MRAKFTLVWAVEFCAFWASLSTNVCLGSFASPCVGGLSFIPFALFYPSVLWYRCLLFILTKLHPPLVVVILSWKSSSLLQVLWFSLFRCSLIPRGSYRTWHLLQARDLAPALFSWLLKLWFKFIKNVKLGLLVFLFWHVNCLSWPILWCSWSNLSLSAVIAFLRC